MNPYTTQTFQSSGVLVADGKIIGPARGVVHTITLSQNDAVPTAGTIILYDNTAESGTVLFSHTQTTAVFMPVTVTLDVPFTTGLYLGFTTTGDVNVVVSYSI